MNMQIIYQKKIGTRKTANYTKQNYTVYMQYVIHRWPIAKEHNFEAQTVAKKLCNINVLYAALRVTCFEGM
jgi:hypothetical protein